MNIKGIRQITGLSQRAFGEKYGIPMRTIQNWETGKRECPQYVTGLLNRVVNEDYKKEKRMRNYIRTSNSLELSALKNREAFNFISDLKCMEKEDFQENIDYISQTIYNCTQKEYECENPEEEISETEAEEFDNEIYIHTSLFGSGVKYYLIEWKELQCVNDEEETCEVINSISAEKIKEALVELFD